MYFVHLKTLQTMKKSVITFLHIGYWVLYLLLLLLVLICLQMGSNLSKRPPFLNWRFDVFLFAMTVVPALVGFYSFYSILFTNYLSKKKLLSFFIAVFLFSLTGAAVGSVCLTLLHWSKVGIGVFSEGLAGALPALIIMAIISFLNGIVGIVMKGFISWYGDIKLKEELTEKNHATELALVKSQLDPHFLFNTINNIDVLIEKDPSTASVYLNKLSHIMRFMLYETKTEKIPLQQELAYIEKYIELQKIRSANPQYVQYYTRISNPALLITPMLFIPFIENAFKHAPNIKEGKVINILITTTNNTLLFECDNIINPNQQLTEAYSGLGHGLIQKRLELLYPGRHTLRIINKDERYTVHLTIECA